jgi:hypothetical protein
VCPRHGGHAPQVVAAAARRREQAAAQQSIAEFLAARQLPTDIPVPQVLADQLARWLGQVTYLHAMVAHLSPDELKQRDLGGKFEKPAVWLEMLWRAEGELRATAKVMDDARLGDRMVALAEQQGQLLNRWLDWLLAELADTFGLPSGDPSRPGYDPRVEMLMETMLTKLAVGELPAGVGT